MLQYNSYATKSLYVFIARHDQTLMNEFAYDMRTLGGIIGNAKFEDIQIREGAMFIDETKLRNNTQQYIEGDVTSIDIDFPWDSDGVWLPIAEVKQ